MCVVVAVDFVVELFGHPAHTTIALFNWSHSPSQTSAPIYDEGHDGVMRTSIFLLFNHTVASVHQPAGRMPHSLWQPDPLSRRG